MDAVDGRLGWRSGVRRSPRNDGKPGRADPKFISGQSGSATVSQKISPSPLLCDSSSQFSTASLPARVRHQVKKASHLLLINDKLHGQGQPRLRHVITFPQALSFEGSMSSHTEIPGRGNLAVSIEHLSKTYPVPFLRLKKFFRRKSKPPADALRDVSIDLREGEIFGLIGPNGAGKTTLIKVIATLIQPTSGSVLVRGYDSVRDDEQVRRNVGLAGAEERSFYWRLTAEQNLLFFARLYGLSRRDARVRIVELFELFEFKDLARRRFAELSTGNKQRLSVARAMLARSPILLLDEPTRSLDPIAAARMRDTIRALARAETNRVTVFLTSHNLAEVEELCDRVAIISKGEIQAIDTPRNLRAIHTAIEHVSIIFAADSPNRVEEALRAAFNNHFLTLGRSEHGKDWKITLSRSVKDDALDRVLRVLQHLGAVILSVETERPSLLDVLVAYEEPDDARESKP
jgi:ABC-2 type transport system ATP-binding protein